MIAMNEERSEAEEKIRIKHLLSFYETCNVFKINSNSDSSCCSSNINENCKTEEISFSLGKDTYEICNVRKEEIHITENYCKEIKPLKLESSERISDDMDTIQFFVCDYCKKKFSLKSHLRRHILQCPLSIPIIDAKKTRRHTCTVCGKAFLSKNHLKRHTLKVNCRNSASPIRRAICCPKCDRRFPQKASLQKHLNSNTCTTSCGVCGYIPRKPCELKRHMVKHTRDRIFCFLCDRKFTRPYMLKKHMFEHRVRLYQCTDCEKNFICLEELNYHRTIRHAAVSRERGACRKSRFKESNATIKRFCDYCEVYFEIDDSYNEHMGKHTSPSGSTQKKKVFRCRFCCKKFTIELWLQYHKVSCRRSVTPSDFKCVVCDLDFASADEFQYHIGTHPVEELKPFGCAYCEQRFIRRGPLIRHLRVCPF